MKAVATMTISLTLALASTALLSVAPAAAQSNGAWGLYDSLCVNRGALTAKDAAVCGRWNQNLRALNPVLEMTGQLTEQLLRSGTSDVELDDEDDRPAPRRRRR